MHAINAGTIIKGGSIYYVMGELQPPNFSRGWGYLRTTKLTQLGWECFQLNPPHNLLKGTALTSVNFCRFFLQCILYMQCFDVILGQEYGSVV